MDYAPTICVILEGMAEHRHRLDANSFRFVSGIEGIIKFVPAVLDT